jgi:BirA family biotin operon repressor/biotin-[acetyl-CoA-carboxylase] ligase
MEERGNMKIIHFDEIDSTNNYCKHTNLQEDCFVVAERQTAGRGTKGRSFLSDDGGIYLSYVRNFPALPTERAFEIMVNSCVAVCKTVQAFGVQPRIRWANDVLVGDKKICGTLIENTFAGSLIKRSIVGIGLNVNNILADEIAPIATSLKRELGHAVDKNAVRELLIANLQKEYTIAEYKQFVDWLGSRVKLLLADGSKEAVALDIEADGRLVVELNGKVQKISSAEVSLQV